MDHVCVGADKPYCRGFGTRKAILLCPEFIDLAVRHERKPGQRLFCQRREQAQHARKRLCLASIEEHLLDCDRADRLLDEVSAVSPHIPALLDPRGERRDRDAEKGWVGKACKLLLRCNLCLE